ncbi:hypothetical protein CEUSTIGMA_g2466.t1 [Chlamydomonas eustigma]|uniref:DUF1995 domain-containing protein n=1 Tax=Chlamydomonas eustigma TaxID=1157962 RepID=A0A250WWX3_9CHLO|nr:hypothetical protein CEUSTIGMA_g2466.t1 [Chlamydomonas eustigma]|eukprot:GAX75020.1 hypothetical protein CEUSTIGMA_g2466.t1 [Chlamydomonas eustigma]
MSCIKQCRYQTMKFSGIRNRRDSICQLGTPENGKPYGVRSAWEVARQEGLHKGACPLRSSPSRTSEVITSAAVVQRMQSTEVALNSPGSVKDQAGLQVQGIDSDAMKETLSGTERYQQVSREVLRVEEEAGISETKQLYSRQRSHQGTSTSDKPWQDAPVKHRNLNGRKRSSTAGSSTAGAGRKTKKMQPSRQLSHPNSHNHAKHASIKGSHSTNGHRRSLSVLLDKLEAVFTQNIEDREGSAGGDMTHRPENHGSEVSVPKILQASGTEEVSAVPRVSEELQRVEIASIPSAVTTFKPEHLTPAKLTLAISAAGDVEILLKLYRLHEPMMNIVHSVTMMKCLSRIVRSQALQRSFASSSSAATAAAAYKSKWTATWDSLCSKALLLLPSASCRHVADILGALHIMAEVRERSHPGWQRAEVTYAAGVGSTYREPATLHQDSTVCLESYTPASESFKASMGINNIDPEPSSISFASSALSESDVTPAASVAPARTASDAVQRGSTSMAPRPLHSSLSVLRPERLLARAALRHSQKLMEAAAAAADPERRAENSASAELEHVAAGAAVHVSAEEMQSMLAVLGKLGLAPGAEWQAAFFSLSLQQLPKVGREELVAMALGVSRLQPAAVPGRKWRTMYYSCTARLMSTFEPKELCMMTTAASRLPRPVPESWIQALIQRCSRCMDSFDAPAYALLLHGVSRMRPKVSRDWVLEMLESSTSLLYDFSTEELSLILRGCSIADVCPDDDWLLEFFQYSQLLLPSCTGPQLANMGWSLAQLRCQPPRRWLNDWAMQLKKRVGGASERRSKVERPLGVRAEKWHGVGYEVHAKRAAMALQAFGIRDLAGWCAMLCVSVPEPVKSAGKPMRRPALPRADSSIIIMEGASSASTTSGDSSHPIPSVALSGPSSSSSAEGMTAELSPFMKRIVSVPQTTAQQASQAAAAIEAAFRDGMRRQHIELYLQPESGQDGWPGGIRQQFRVAQPLVESILRRVKQAGGLEGPLSAEIWDQGDAVAAYTGTKVAAVLFPTAESMDRLKAMINCSSGGPELLLVFNPQWETKGLMLGQSDFGFGARRASSEALVASLQPSYQLKELRLQGDEIRVLRAHPGRWQVHVLDRSGSSDLLAVQLERPTYQQVEEMLRSRPESKMNLSIIDRLRDEWPFGRSQ